MKKYIGVTNLLTKQQEEKRNNLKIPYDKLIEQTQIMLDEDIEKLKFTDKNLKIKLQEYSYLLTMDMKFFLSIYYVRKLLRNFPVKI